MSKHSNRNQKGRKSWIEIVETYNSAGELGNHGFDITEISIMNTSQVQKTAMGITENMWIVDAVCNMFDKMMLAAIQICGLKDHKTKKNVTEQDGEDVMKIWTEARRLLMKGKEEVPRNAERMPIPGCSIYQRKYQITDETDITTATQCERRSESEKHR